MAITRIETGEVTYKGAVLSVSVNDNYQIMSDVWGYAQRVLVYQADSKAANKFVSLNYNIGEYGVDKSYKIEIDATPEVIQLYLDERYRMELDRLLFQEEKRVSALEVGAKVKVFKGRKIPIGTEGTILKIIDGSYGKTALVADMDSGFKMVTSKYGKQFKQYNVQNWVTLANLVRTDIADIDIQELMDQAMEHAVRAVHDLKDYRE